MIYFDASALVTLVSGRAHAAGLRKFLESCPDADTCTSTIGFIETVRTCDRIGDYPNLLPQLLRMHIEVPVTDHVRDVAVGVPGGLPSLDAIHVASAEVLGPALIALVTYDRRMADAARDAGLPVAMPGTE
ncbi:MAG: type II toxin-antitoxin system VapC family toxin [Haloechinothrix sp.]